MSRDAWAEINARPSKLKPFGSALTDEQAKTIPAPFYITEPTKTLTRPELKSVPPIPVEHLRAIMRDGQ